MYQTIIHLILIGLVFAMLFLATSASASSRGVKQQVLEKQIALVIDSANIGTTIVVQRVYQNGVITDLKIQGGKVYVAVDSLESNRGYGYFSKYSVSSDSDKDNYYIYIK